MPEYLGSYGHVAVCLDNYIMVIGGIDMNSEPVSTHVILMYNVYTDQWRKHQIPVHKNAPPPVACACAVAIGTDIYMFGGFELDKKLNTETNELWKLTEGLQCIDWSKIEFYHDVKLPSPRCDHSGWKYKECLWVFGGFGPFSSKYLNDHGDFFNKQNNQLLCYDPATQKWTNPQCFGTVPCPRRAHSTAVIRDKVWLFSGLYLSNIMVDPDDFYELDMHSYTWTQITTGGTKPQKRFFSSLSAVSDSQLVLRGGAQYILTVKGGNMHLEQNLLNDTWIMDLSSHTWRKYASNLDHHRENHTGSFGVNKSIIIIGGYSDSHTYKTYTPTFEVILEPKSLQWLAMKTIYSNQDILSWKCLPSKLVAQLGILDKKEMTTNEECE